MASDGSPVTKPVASVVHQGHVARVPPKAHVPAPPPAQRLAASLNKVLNQSGRPTQFRVDPTSANKVIQQINPETGEVVGQFAASEFPALASVLRASGLFVDTRV